MNHLIDRLFPPSEIHERGPVEVYAVLDGARERRVYRSVYESRLDYECLFTGNLPYDLAESAPYLVRLTRTAELTSWILTECWGNSVGIFAWSRENLNTLRRHFRHLLQVQDEQGQKLFFRYYDPRVLRTYIPTCMNIDLKELFGPIDRLLVEGLKNEVLSCEPRVKEGARYLEWERAVC